MAVMREMTQETVKWIKDFLEAVKDCFGERLLCAGIQGSRAHGEEKANSDIDVVVILDKLDFDDLKAYDDVVSALPEREKLCGFLSGCAELAAWEKSELFQFVFDTKVLYGSLDFVQLGTEEDLRRAVHSGACGLYHACVHNILHEKSPEILRELYKSAFFTLQMKYFAETGEYISGKETMRRKTADTDRIIAAGAISVRTEPGVFTAEFERLARRLMEWSGALITTYPQ